MVCEKYVKIERRRKNEERERKRRREHTLLHTLISTSCVTGHAAKYRESLKNAPLEQKSNLV